MGGASSFVGCIDRVTLGGHFLPLLLPSERGVSISTCDPRPPAQSVRETIRGAWLLGADSFITIGTIPVTWNQFNVTFLFRTFTSFGTLYAGCGLQQLLVLVLHEGRLQVHMTNSLQDSPLTSTFTYNSGLQHQVSVQYFNGSLIVSIDNAEHISSQLSNVSGNSFLPFNQVNIIC